MWKQKTSICVYLYPVLFSYPECAYSLMNVHIVWCAASILEWKAWKNFPVKDLWTYSPFCIFYVCKLFHDCSVTLASLIPWLIQRKVMSSYDVNTKTVGVTTLNQTNDIACWAKLLQTCTFSFIHFFFPVGATSLILQDQTYSKHLLLQ